VTSRTVVRWTRGMAFEVALQGHRFMVDAAEQLGGANEGPRPKSLVLSGLAGCTGMDVVSLLNKMRVPFDSLRVEVEGKTADEHPKVYTDILVRYVLTGKQLDREKIEKAVELSVHKYCAVHVMLAKTANMRQEIVLNPEMNPA
jgi:putative redox protein